MNTKTEVPSTLKTLQKSIEGDVYSDLSSRVQYATDASVYRELPTAVCRPMHLNDLKKILDYANQNDMPLVPRTAGTSLAGQVVGHGIVVDFSKYMNRILELNTEERWVRVQPGVILDDLNDFLKPHGLFFGPETSTSNRCMMGGMVANNSCGSHSLIYGSTRDHTQEIHALLSDGSQTVFQPLNKEDFRKKCVGNSLENKIYDQLFNLLSDEKLQEEIKANYPDPRIHRRNMGYALDLMLDNEIFSDTEKEFNFCTLLAGSEGSLALFYEIKLNLVDLPPANTALVCVHVNSIEEALQANLVALKHRPAAVELIDRIVLDCTKTNISQSQNRIFIKGDPDAILVVEFAENTPEVLQQKIDALIHQMQNENMGYHYPVLRGKDMGKVWAVRKAGLGLLSNIPGDAKPVAVIEDTAVHTDVLPDFVSELKQHLDRLQITCVYYAHIGTGEIHLRPILNLKNPVDVEKFYEIAKQTAHLVKKYRGSLSGEHGDGRLRGEFIPLMFGDRIYNVLKQIKQTWDPKGILNPGKITDTPSMKSNLRYQPGLPPRDIKTYFRYPESDGFLRGVEKCNGSGDCRKPHTRTGVMCPSYQATTNEKDTTRARANILREFITQSPQKNPFNHHEIKEILDLCLSCKGCKSECPSNVDMGKYKAEFLQNYYDANKVPFRSKLIANYNTLNQIGRGLSPAVFNLFSQSSVLAPITKKISGFAPERSLPKLSVTSWRSWARKNLAELNKNADPAKKVVLFCDEFTNHNDAQTGINATRLLIRLGYFVEMPQHAESGRAGLSKGLLKKVKKLADKNIENLHPFAEKGIPVIGIEPSAILCLRDEYKDLCKEELSGKALELSENTFMIDEFISKEAEKGHITKKQFRTDVKKIYLHGHCHQKALSKTDYTKKMLMLPAGHEVENIECGCCGMAGAFGYEKEHYQISMSIGELSLFPAVRAAEPDAIIAAPGTSCRHQIFDGTSRRAYHPVDILFEALMG